MEEFNKLSVNLGLTLLHYAIVTVPISFLWKYLVEIGHLPLPDIGYVGCLAVLVIFQLLTRQPQNPPVVNVSVCTDDQLREIAAKVKGAMEAEKNTNVQSEYQQ